MRPVLTVTLDVGGANAFLSIVDGKQKPFVGFLPPGVSLTTLRHDARRISGTLAYGESERGDWGHGKKEFTYLAVVGPNVIGVGAITADNPERAAARGMAFAVGGSTDR